MEKESIIHRLPLMPVIWGVTCLIIGGLVGLGLYGYYSAADVTQVVWGSFKNLLFS